MTQLVAAAAGLTAVAAPVPAMASPSATTNTAILVTGDQVTVTTAPDGRETAEVLPAAETGLARELVHLEFGGRSYEIPAAALPYLGRGLDLSLFDVHALLGAERDGRIPVHIAGNTQVPGVTPAGDGQGYLTADSARQFSAALVRQFLNDRARGSYGEQGLFARTTISLPGAAAQPVRPKFVMRTLTVKAKGADGKPDNGNTAIVFNVDNSNLVDPTESTNVFVDGEAKFSVPDGHYAVLGLFFDTDSDGNVTAVRYSVQPELTVSADMSTRVDARAATSKVTWQTPKPAQLLDGGFLLRRAPATGAAMTVDVSTGDGVPVWVSPTRKPVAVGAMQSYPYNRLGSPPGPGTPYEYQLQQASFGVIPEQRYVVTEQQLATIDANYYSELNVIGLRQRAGVYPFEDGQSHVSHPIDLPRKQTEYVSADPSITWYGGLAKYYQNHAGFNAWYGAQYDAMHSYRPGQRLREDWNRFPLHPAGEFSLVDPGKVGYTVPAATRAGDTLRLNITPFTDNQPGHLGLGFAGEARDTMTGSYELDQDGVRIAGDDALAKNAMGLETEATVSGDPATLKLVLDAGRVGPMYTLSTQTHTEWTWKSSHQAGGTLPNAFACVFSKGDTDRSCGVEPLLTLGYAVGGLDVDGTVRSGAQSLDLTAAHLQQSAASAVTGASVQYSLDDGATWQDAQVTGQDGTYHATFTATTHSFNGTPVALRVTASDANGGQISETIHGAYQVVA